MKPEPPFRTIGVAVAFSPRVLQVLAEAKRIHSRLGRNLNLIFVGEKNAETNAKFARILQELELPADLPIHFQKGDPAAAILQAAAKNKIDLIVAGALEKEVVLRPFLGNVARRLVREANCSVMLFTKPERLPTKLTRMVFMAAYNDHAREALRKTLHLAVSEGAEKLFVVRVYTSFDEARAARRTADHDSTARTLEEEEVALEKFIDSVGATEVPIEARCIRGNTGYAAADFAQSVEANLLVVPVQERSELPPRVAWVTETIPCNLWIIR